MLTERHFKNEDAIKEKIVRCRRAGIKKPRKFGSMAKTYVCRDGNWVLKE